MPIDRSARREAVLVRQVVALLDAGPFGEEVVCVQRVIAVELPDGAAQLVRARLERRVEHGAARAAVLGAERAGQDLDLVDGVDRRLDDVGDAAQEIDVARVVVDPVQQVVVLRRPHAVGGKHQRRAGALLRRHDAGGETGEDRVVAAVDRQILDLSDVSVSPTVPVPVWSSGASAVTTTSSAECRRLQREVDDRLLLDARR